MNLVVWIVTGLLAAGFLMTGIMKLRTSKQEMVADPHMAWAGDFSPGMLKFIGAAEVAGAVGLILPAGVDVATWLVPTAAIGLALVMVGAAITHLRRREYSSIVTNAVLFAAAVFVAIERLGPQSF